MVLIQTTKYSNLKYIIMNNILDDLFYTEKLGIGIKLHLFKMLEGDTQKLK